MQDNVPVVISHETDGSLCVKGDELPDVLGFTHGLHSKYDRVDAEFERHLFYFDLNHCFFVVFFFTPPTISAWVMIHRLLSFLCVPILQCTTFRGVSLIFPLELLNFISLRHFDSD